MNIPTIAPRRLADCTTIEEERAYWLKEEADLEQELQRNDLSNDARGWLTDDLIEVKKFYNTTFEKGYTLPK